jgi:hypothetical protein
VEKKGGSILMKEDKLYEIGQMLELSKTEVKTAIIRNRNKILAGLIIGLASILGLNNGYQPLHYAAPSIKDFDFFMRYF